MKEKPFYEKLCISKSPIEGLGVFAKKPIKKGELVLRFSGKTATEADFKRRNRYCFQTSKDGWLLAAGPEKYVNHSCSPNAGMRGNLCLVALRNIKRNEEITFDYATAENRMRMKCRCGSDKCRKTISGYSGLTGAEKKRIANRIASHLKQPKALQ